METTELPPGQYIFGVHPHGVMPFSAYPIGKTAQWPQLFPGIRVQGPSVSLTMRARPAALIPSVPGAALTASCLFRMPITRELALWAGGIDASRTTAEYVVRRLSCRVSITTLRAAAGVR